MTNIANTSQSEDLTALMTLSLTFPETTYSGTADFTGEATETFSGTYTIEGNQLTLNETGKLEPDTMTYTLVGDTMTLSGLDDQHDFDGDGVEDPASWVMVLQRQ